MGHCLIPTIAAMTSLFICSSCSNKHDMNIIRESFNLSEQSEDSVLRFGQKVADLGIDDPELSHIIDLALDYVRLRNEYNDVMDSLNEE